MRAATTVSHETSATGEVEIQAQSLSVRFGGVLALDNVSMAAERGLVTALIGPNGAGKSTLLNAVSGFVRPSQGRVLFRGHEVTGLPPHERVRRGMARTFQDLEVFPHLSVLENTVLGLQDQWGERIWRLLATPRAVARQRALHIGRAHEILRTVGLEDLAGEMARNLSYGHQKLLVLARLLATDATLLMLDEPGAGLAADMVDQIGSLLKRIADSGKTVLLVDHNMSLVMRYAHRVFVLHAGRLVTSGSPDEVRAHPEVIRVYLRG